MPNVEYITAKTIPKCCYSPSSTFNVSNLIITDRFGSRTQYNQKGHIDFWTKLEHILKHWSHLHIKCGKLCIIWFITIYLFICYILMTWVSTWTTGILKAIRSMEEYLALIWKIKKNKNAYCRFWLTATHSRMSMI